MWVLWSKIYFIKTVFENFMKWGLKGGISIDADSGPLRYVLWCWGNICHQLFTFMQIYSGHTVFPKRVCFLIFCRFLYVPWSFSWIFFVGFFGERRRERVVNKTYFYKDICSYTYFELLSASQDRVKRPWVNVRCVYRGLFLAVD